MKSLKVLGKRMRHLNSKVAIMTHYWKIRCAERKTLCEKMTILDLKLKRAEVLIEKLAGQNVRGYKTKKGEKTYLLRLTHNDTHRLVSFIKLNLHYNRYAKKVFGKQLIHLTRDEHAKLSYMLKRKKLTGNDEL